MSTKESGRKKREMAGYKGYIAGVAKATEGIRELKERQSKDKRK